MALTLTVLLSTLDDSCQQMCSSSRVKDSLRECVHHGRCFTSPLEAISENIVSFTHDNQHHKNLFDGLIRCILPPCKRGSTADLEHSHLAFLSDRIIFVPQLLFQAAIDFGHDHHLHYLIQRRLKGNGNLSTLVIIPHCLPLRAMIWVPNHHHYLNKQLRCRSNSATGGGCIEVLVYHSISWPAGIGVIQKVFGLSRRNDHGWILLDVATFTVKPYHFCDAQHPRKKLWCGTRYRKAITT